MNQYKEMQERQQEAYNQFSKENCLYAFNEKQLAEGMQKLGLDPATDKEKIQPIGAGGFVLKDRSADLKALFDSFHAERQAAIEADQSGEGFIYQMFLYELYNHEYGFTGDETDAINACGLDYSDIEKNPALKHGLNKAMREIMKGEDA